MKLTEKSARGTLAKFKRYKLDHDQICACSDGWEFFESRGYLQGVEDQREIIKKLVQVLEKIHIRTPDLPGFIYEMIEEALESTRRVK